jgi:hypothetical protein
MILMILVILVGLLNFYLADQQLKLFQLGVFRTPKRMSLKIIDEALINENNKEHYVTLNRVKLIYWIYLLLFYLTIVIVAFKIYCAATK